MLRKRKNRRYNEEANDEEGDGERKFDIQEQIKTKRFDQIKEKHLLELSGEDITLRLIQRDGFEKPILVSEPSGLDLRVPPKSFLVRDVRNCVGHQRIIDVMDVKTQKNIEMSMKDWCKYYESKNRDKLLNVISLEFSHTKLDELVESPMIVKLLDWVDLVWPKFLKESQTESTNSIDRMKYPKVQKYCLMSVRGSYTDFHIDFGGTSVWYHILRGKKIFWMVPPTELNLQIFEEWTLSGMQQDVFFGDTVEECFRVELSAGNTFFIPSGWIHAVYTLEDSLVFGGNFLHSFGIENQLKVSRIEDATKVPVKFRYPFYTEILWYVAQHYVYCLTEKDHLHRPEPQTVSATNDKQSSESSSKLVGGKKKVLELEDDELIESEHEESDTKKRKATSNSASAKRKRTIAQGRGKKAARKNTGRTKKTSIIEEKEDEDEDEDDDDETETDEVDDESTDIDSSNEDNSKQTQKPTVNTCRMTKNSLLRLQYDIEDQQVRSPNKSQTSPPKSGDNIATTKGNPTKKKSSTESSAPKDLQISPSKASINLAEIVLSHESSKLNGWSAGVGWSSLTNSNPVEPKRIHLTKYELNGLKVLIKHLSKLSGAKKNLPNLIRNSRALLDDCRKLIAEHENDDPELAITGKPITPELLREPKKADINELIGQFFKPTDEDDDARVAQANSNLSPLNSKIKSESSSNQRFKNNSSSSINNNNNNTNDRHSSESVKAFKKSGEDISSIAATNKKSSHATDTKSSNCNNNSLRSPSKETKCLSPTKKSSISNPSLASASSSTASPPPRVKSPPTRPLSNNQYTSKTKSNSNLLLPGSFADLIAATSTEKKVFDTGGSSTGSSLFGLKDLGKSSSNKKQVADKSQKQASSKTDSIESASTLAPATVSAPNAAPVGAGAASSTLTATTSKTISNQGVNNKPNSPEPPKPNTMQKRLITPNSRPQNKEKLIYASAPYISPVHASDPSRSVNSFPWQTPSHSQGPSSVPPKGNPSQSTSYSPTLPRLPSHSSAQPTIPSSILLSPTVLPPFIPGDLRQAQSAQQQHRHQQHDQSRPQSMSSEKNPPEATDLHPVKNQASIKEPTQVSVLVKPGAHQPQSSPNSVPTNSLIKSNTTKLAAPSSESSPTNVTVPTLSSDAAGFKASNEDDLAKAKNKPNKPRGPPKKSKEARQAIMSGAGETSLALPSASQTMNVSMITPVPAQPSTSSGAPAAAQQTNSLPNPKVAKTKRSKKQKDPAANSQTQASKTAPAIKVAPINHLIRPQGSAANVSQQSLVCGLVRPTASVSSSQISPQPYFISSPVMMNTMPAFSAAQLQQMQRGPMPIFTTPMATSSLRQPARQQIVWATAPRSLAPGAQLFATRPIASSAGTSVAPQILPVAGKSSQPPMMALLPTSVQPRPLKVTPATTNAAKSLHSPDNAALLSLATTALSSAPMVNSPALSHLSSRAPSPQAIMMSHPGSVNHQALFAANQQFFRPFVQRLPMAQYFAQPAVSSAGAAGTALPSSGPRPTGQYLLARLPSQQRFIIAPQGFVHQHFPTPHVVTSQSTPTLAFAAYKPTPADSSKPMKNKKIKTDT